MGQTLRAALRRRIEASRDSAEWLDSTLQISAFGKLKITKCAEPDASRRAVLFGAEVQRAGTGTAEPARLASAAWLGRLWSRMGQLSACIFRSALAGSHAFSFGAVVGTTPVAGSRVVQQQENGRANARPSSFRRPLPPGREGRGGCLNPAARPSRSRRRGCCRPRAPGADRSPERTRAGCWWCAAADIR